jgi:hypothetical protein
MPGLSKAQLKAKGARKANAQKKSNNFGGYEGMYL